jgi:hypothetical protein
MNYAIGVITAILEMRGSLKLSRTLYKFAPNIGRRMDGYDAAYSILHGI